MSGLPIRRRFREGETGVVESFTFLDSAGAPVDLSGFTADLLVTAVSGARVVSPADVDDAAGGVVSWVWPPSALMLPGVVFAVVRVSDGSQTLLGGEYRLVVDRG